MEKLCESLTHAQAHSNAQITFNHEKILFFFCFHSIFFFIRSTLHFHEYQSLDPDLFFVQSANKLQYYFLLLLWFTSFLFRSLFFALFLWIGDAISLSLLSVYYWAQSQRKQMIHDSFIANGEYTTKPVTEWSASFYRRATLIAADDDTSIRFILFVGCTQRQSTELY